MLIYFNDIFSDTNTMANKTFLYLEVVMIKTVIFYLLVLLICFFVSCGSSLPEANLILINGNIYTVDENMPKAQAVAISGFNIMTVGTNEQISQ